MCREPTDGLGAKLVTAIYTGSDVGQPIVDGSGLVSDGTKLYAADEVDGTVASVNFDGSGLTILGSRYAGGFSTDAILTLATNSKNV